MIEADEKTISCKGLVAYAAVIILFLLLVNYIIWKDVQKSSARPLGFGGWEREFTRDGNQVRIGRNTVGVFDQNKKLQFTAVCEDTTYKIMGAHLLIDGRTIYLLASTMNGQSRLECWRDGKRVLLMPMGSVELAHFARDESSLTYEYTDPAPGGLAFWNGDELLKIDPFGKLHQSEVTPKDRVELNEVANDILEQKKFERARDFRERPKINFFRCQSNLYQNTESAALLALVATGESKDFLLNYCLENGRYTPTGRQEGAHSVTYYIDASSKIGFAEVFKANGLNWPETSVYYEIEGAPKASSVSLVIPTLFQENRVEVDAHAMGASSNSSIGFFVSNVDPTKSIILEANGESRELSPKPAPPRRKSFFDEDRSFFGRMGAVPPGTICMLPW